MRRGGAAGSTRLRQCAPDAARQHAARDNMRSPQHDAGPGAATGAHSSRARARAALLAFSLARFTSTGWRRSLMYICTVPRFTRMSRGAVGAARFALATTTLAVIESLGARWQPTFTVGVALPECV